MSAVGWVVAGQILGLAVACGLNLYLAVATIGILSRFDIVTGLPPGLQGLESLIVIGSALALFAVEAVIDKNPHVDALWDTVHTFIRPPAAALLTVAALWGRPPALVATAAAAALLVALSIHGTKTGLRLVLNTAPRGGRVWISLAEDLLALAFAALAFADPRAALIGSAAVLLAILLVGPAYWRAVALGVRALGAWLSSLFDPAGWREEDHIPRKVRRLLEPTPLGTAPPRATRAALDGAGAGSFRNGWLVLSGAGGVFVYRTAFGHRRVDLPTPLEIHGERGTWADLVRVRGESGEYTLFLLKDGPRHDLVTSQLEHFRP